MTNNSFPDILLDAVNIAKTDNSGDLASYIPELASVDEDLTSVSLITLGGRRYREGDHENHIFTLQSVSKVPLLIALLEELGHEEVFKWVSAEPSGTSFASLARQDKHGPVPCNPLLNSGAIALCDKIPGNENDRFEWLKKWMHITFGEHLTMNEKIYESESQTGDRNRSIAYLLKNNGVLKGDVDSVLDTYFRLCSFETSVYHAAYLPMLLANAGCNLEGEQILKRKTITDTISIMATCGLYNQTGTHMVNTGMPAKSGVSGLLVALIPNKCGIAVASPRINQYGTSVRGEIMLEVINQHTGWHFAIP